MNRISKIIPKVILGAGMAAAAAQSMDLISAWAWGLRTIRICS